jgi:hypothetical protein
MENKRLDTPENSSVVIVERETLKKPVRPLKPRKKRKNGTGSIFTNRQKNKISAQIDDLHGITRTASFDNEQDAERWLY